MSAQDSLARGGISTNVASCKNEIKVSAEGVAKLTFSYIEELDLQGDSSLEPGEVKTPPHVYAKNVGTTNLVAPATTTVVAVVENDDTPKKQSIVKQNKSISQMEAEACQEKVRAILELDAIRRREDAEKRKEQLEKRRRSGEMTDEDESKRRAKEERKRLKRLKKEQKAARLALLSDDDELDLGNLRKKRRTKSRENLLTMYTAPEKIDEQRSIGNTSSAGRFSVAVPSHLNAFPETFMGYRPMNPFIRGSRPDFHQTRGGYVPRGRGGMRGNSRFPGYRPPFYSNGPAPLRHHAPMQRQHTPPPSRGHSPITAPKYNLQWTKTMPSISFAFNTHQSVKTKDQQTIDDLTSTVEKPMMSEDNSRYYYSKNKQQYISKKKFEREAIKKRRSSRNSSEKSCRRQIEKIRSSINSNKSQPNIGFELSHSATNKRDITESRRSSDSEEMWDAVENIKVEKVDNVVLKEITPPLELAKDIVKVEKNNEMKLNDEIANDAKVELQLEPTTTMEVMSAEVNAKAFDMFADSPPRTIKHMIKSDKQRYENVALSTIEKDKNHEKIQNVEKSNVSTAQSSSLEERGTTPPLPSVPEKLSEKRNAHQKAIEIRKRIDELLQDDDLKLETIQATKEKLLEKASKRKKETSSSTDKVVPHINPFKRSLSRDRYFGKIDSNRRRSRTRESDNKIYKRRPSMERNNRSGDRMRARSKSHHSTGSSGSLNRTHSGRNSQRRDRSGTNEDNEKHSNRTPRSVERKTMESSNPTKSNSAQVVSKAKQSKVETHKRPGSKKNKVIAPLSFTAAEFLFPEDGDQDDSINDDDDTASSSKNKKSAAARDAVDADVSPDTDDYMDNWENDDADLDINSNTACDSSTPLRSSQEDTDDKYDTHFVNPSPPTDLLKSIASDTNASRAVEVESTTPTTSPPQGHLPPVSKTEPENLLAAVSEIFVQTSRVQNNELFGMQELYDQFIKSVEDTGVDIKSIQSPSGKGSLVVDITSNIAERSLSTSSTTTSSTSTSSSSSDDSNSSTSSSSSSASSSDDSNDGDSFQKSPKPSTKKLEKFSPSKPKELDLISMCSPKIAADEYQENRLNSNLTTPATTAPLAVLPSPSMSDASLTAVPTTVDVQPTQKTESKTQQQVKAQKSEVAKDFKKLKSLESNLTRIQMMLSNYDSNDEISDELFKMEKLFLQEKNLILQKYAKSSLETNQQLENSATQPDTNEVHNMPSTPVLQTLQNTEVEYETNKIFDVNREAIKLTISPLKLPKTPAIFESTVPVGNKQETTKSSRAHDDAEDFTEKLIKPAKEIAIVKPMMESKDSRSTQHHRRSPTRNSNSRTRSPAGYRSRRSTSRSRLHSPQRQARGGRSLSVSPPRRGSGVAGRHLSPQRRGGYRYRNSSRRSRRKTGQQRSMRDSRSRSRSPDTSYHRSLRPHSPRSPPPSQPLVRRRSYSRERYSRSPLPFKPPSPPMRRSLSPSDQRRSPLHSRSLSSLRSRSRSHSRSLSPRMPRSPRSSRSPRSPRSPPPTRYDDHRRRRGSSYDRHSLSPQRQAPYYISETASAAASSSYYYNASPNRISLDARINIVLNGPPGQDGAAASNMSPYEGYHPTYDQYGGGTATYMSLPPQPQSGNSGNYYANHYMPISNSGGPVHSPHPTHHPHHQQIYSNIPTISGTGGGGPPAHHHLQQQQQHHVTPPPHYYYNSEYGVGVIPAAHPSSVSLLKELPKATTVAVQKGNVLEIVPSNEVPDVAAASAISKMSETVATKPVKTKNTTTITWKEEVNNRLVKSAVMRLSRETDGSSYCILKKTTDVEQELSKDDKPPKKKVYFEDGIFPNRDSDNEDRKVIDAKIRNKVRRLRKLRGITIDTGTLVTSKPRKEKPKVDSALEKLPPPPPPVVQPPTHLEQPVCLRPPTPTSLLYFHFDAVVHSMYVSQLERPIPPRLLNPKCVPSGNVANVGGIPSVQNIGTVASQSPSHVQSPIGGGASVSHLHSSKKDLTTLAAINRSSRSSPKMMQSIPAVAQRRENPAMTFNMKAHSPIEVMQHHLHPSPLAEQLPPPTQLPISTMTKGTFQSISVPISPQMAVTHSPPPQRQGSPIGFVGMRMRLPPSPLARGPSLHPPVMSAGQNAIPVMMRGNYNMPPPNVLPPPMMGSPMPNEFGPPPLQQQYSHHMQFHDSLQTRHYNAAAAAAVPLPPMHAQQPLHYRQAGPPPQHYFMQQTAPASLPPSAVNIPPPTTSTITATDMSMMQSSPQAMVAPYNIKKS